MRTCISRKDSPPGTGSRSGSAGRWLHSGFFARSASFCPSTRRSRTRAGRGRSGPARPERPGDGTGRLGGALERRGVDGDGRTPLVGGQVGDATGDRLRLGLSVLGKVEAGGTARAAPCRSSASCRDGRGGRPWVGQGLGRLATPAHRTRSADGADRADRTERARSACVPASRGRVPGGRGPGPRGTARTATSSTVRGGRPRRGRAGCGRRRCRAGCRRPGPRRSLRSRCRPWP